MIPECWKYAYDLKGTPVPRPGYVYMCEKCKKKFRALRTHMIVHDGNVMEIVICTHCGNMIRHTAD